MSWPLAGRTMLFDVINHRWSEWILSELEIDDSKLSRTLSSGSVVGKVGSSIANDLGVADGMLVVAGGHDQPCCALGAGVVSAGRAVYGMGTVECITPAFDKPVFNEKLKQSNLCTYDYTVTPMYTTVAYSLTGGNALKWFKDTFEESTIEEAKKTGRDVYDILMERLPSLPSDLLVLPYLTPSGTPYFDTKVPGAILGIRLSTDKYDILKALLEGVTMEMRLNLAMLDEAGLSVNELVVTGGSAKSKILLQLKADILGRPIYRPEVTEGGCLGAALLACSSHTNSDIRELAASWVRMKDVFEPNDKYAAIYDEKFAHYRELYPTIKNIVNERNS